MPLPPGASVGTLPDGSLTWIDASGNPINADGTPITGQTATRVTPTAPTAPTTTPAPTATTQAQPTQPAVNANPPATTTPLQTATTAATTAAQNPPSLGQPQGPQGMYTVDQATKAAADEVQQANLNVAAIGDQVSKQQQIVDDLQKGGVAKDPTGTLLTNATSTLNALYNQMGTAQQRVMTANSTYSTSLHNAIQNNLVDPSSIDLATKQAAKADADAKEAQARTNLLTDDTPGSQRALNAAQATAAAARGAADQATAAATALKAGPEADQLTAQAKALNAQADSTTAQLPGLIDKTQAEVGQLKSQTDLNAATAAKTGAETDLVKAQTDYQKATTTGLLPAQIAETQARGGLQGAQAQAALAGIQQNQLGTMYGLQQRVDAYKQLIGQVSNQVFGPGGSGKPEDANDLLERYGGNLLQQSIIAGMGGTTPAAAAGAAATAQQNIFQTQAGMANQASQAAAARANAYASLGGGALGTLEQMNQYAPKGSTAMAGAFGSVMDYMNQRLQQGAMAPPNMQQMAPTPQLPAFLQAFAAGHQAGTAQATAQQQGGQGGQAPTINVNVNGQPAGAAPALLPSTPQQNAAAAGLNPWANPSVGLTNPASGPVGQPTLLSNTSGTPAPTGSSPADAFSQGYAASAPTMPNYLGSLVNPLSMLQSAKNLYGQGINATPGLGAMAGIA